MRILLNRITVSLFFTTILASIILTSFVWISQIVRYFFLITKYNIDIHELLSSSILLLPDFLTTILPISFAISTAYIYEKLRTSNQLTAALYTGINYYELAKPLLLNAYFFMSCIFITNFFISPKFLHEFKVYQSNAMEKINFRNKSSIVNYRGLSFFVKEKTSDNKIKGIVVCDSSKGTNYTMQADSGEINNDIINNKIDIKLSHGSREDFQSSSPSIFSFNSYETTIPYKKKTFEKRPYEKFIFELLTSKFDKDISEAHKKITSPLLVIIYAMIVYLLLVNIEANRKSNIKALSLAAISIALIQSLQILIFNISVSYNFFNILFYIVNPGLCFVLYKFLTYEK